MSKCRHLISSKHSKNFQKTNILAGVIQARTNKQSVSSILNSLLVCNEYVPPLNFNLSNCELIKILFCSLLYLKNYIKLHKTINMFIHIIQKRKNRKYHHKFVGKLGCSRDGQADSNVLGDKYSFPFSQLGQ